MPINSFVLGTELLQLLGRFSAVSQMSEYYDANGICVTQVLPRDVLPVNLGGLLLQALLEYWPRTHINPMDEEENEINHG